MLGGTAGSTASATGSSATSTSGATAAGEDEPGGSDTPPVSDDTLDTGTTAGCILSSWFLDDDGDGFGDPGRGVEACEAPAEHVEDNTDCDDDDDSVYPGAAEPCGGPDTDCDFQAPPLCNSCLQLLASGLGDDDGLYTIDPDGDEGSLPPTQVWCNQTTDGGGWTLAQRTVWDPAQTMALRTGYADWYNLTIGNPSPGQGYRLQGAAWESLNIQLDHMLAHYVRRQSDGGSCEPLYYVGTGGTLTVGESQALLTGLVADVTMINDTQLSTLDSGPGAACVTGGTATPWFYGSCCTTCPTYQAGYWSEPHPMEPYTDDVPDVHGNTEADACSSPAQPAMTGGYRGVNAMEYYLR